MAAVNPYLAALLVFSSFASVRSLSRRFLIEAEAEGTSHWRLHVDCDSLGLEESCDDKFRGPSTRRASEFAGRAHNAQAAASFRGVIPTWHRPSASAAKLGTKLGTSPTHIAKPEHRASWDKAGNNTGGVRISSIFKPSSSGGASRSGRSEKTRHVRPDRASSASSLNAQELLRPSSASEADSLPSVEGTDLLATSTSEVDTTDIPSAETEMWMNAVDAAASDESSHELTPLNAAEPTALDDVVSENAKVVAHKHELLVRDTRAKMSNCAEPGHLVFLHVMKTGGIAVDDFLVCQGKAQGWPIYRHDGQAHTAGRADCPAAVCTLHGNLAFASAPANCGPDFENAKAFTVLREPVDRVWSFYNYIRNDKKYQPYQDQTLMQVLSSVHKRDLNDGLDSGRCSFCHVQLANTMVLYNFAGPNTRAAFHDCWGKVRGNEAHQACAPTHEQLTEALEEAKVVLASMHKVFVMEDLSRLDEIFDADDKMFPRFRNEHGKSFKKQPNASCKMPVKNPTSYAVPSASIDEMELITELNWADVELYNFAQTLPNRAK